MRWTPALLAVFLLAGCTGGGEEAVSRTPPRTRAIVPGAPQVVPRAAGSVKAGPHAQTTQVAFAAGTVWVTSYGGDPQHFWTTRIDPSTLAVERRIRTVGGPTWEVGGGGTTYDAGSMWAVGATGRDPVDGRAPDAVLNRIDVTTDHVTTVRLGGFVGADVAVADSGVWAASLEGSCHGHSRLFRIDPRSNSVVASHRLATSYVRGVMAVGGVIVVDERYWTGRTCQHAGPLPLLESFDPVSGRRLAESKPRGDAEIGSVRTWRGQLWASTSDGLIRLDPRTLVQIGRPVRGVCCFLTSSRYGIWLSGGVHHTLGLFDPVRRSVRWFRGIEAGAIAAAAGPHTLWLLDYNGRVRKMELRP